MLAHALTDLADETLLSSLSALVSAERQNTAVLLAHLAEVEARKLYRPVGYSTMHEYCVGALHLSDDSAYKRLRAARVARRFPQIFEAIADGRLHVSGVAVLAPHLTDENFDGLIAEATHRRKMDIEVIVARLAPRPDVPDQVRALAPAPQAIAGDPRFELAPGPNLEQPAEPFTLVKPLAPERFAFQTTISQATREKLEQAKELMSHRNPSGDLGVVLDAALDALIERLEKQKFATTRRPRAAKAREEGADPTYIPAEVRRAVYERDRGSARSRAPTGCVAPSAASWNSITRRWSAAAGSRRSTACGFAASRTTSTRQSWRWARTSCVAGVRSRSAIATSRGRCAAWASRPTRPTGR
jgi:hypothetical protein